MDSSSSACALACAQQDTRPEFRAESREQRPSLTLSLSLARTHNHFILDSWAAGPRGHATTRRGTRGSPRMRTAHGHTHTPCLSGKASEERSLHIEAVVGVRYSPILVRLLCALSVVVQR